MGGVVLRLGSAGAASARGVLTSPKLAKRYARVPPPITATARATEPRMLMLESGAGGCSSLAAAPPLRTIDTGSLAGTLLATVGE